MEKESWLDPIDKQDLMEFASQQSLMGNYRNSFIYFDYGKMAVLAFNTARDSGDHYFTPFAFSTIGQDDYRYTKSGEQDYDLFVIKDMIEKFIFVETEEGCYKDNYEYRDLFVVKAMIERRLVAGPGNCALQETITLWKNWIEFVDKKNEGRKIDGLTFKEDLKSQIDQYFESRKQEECKNVDARIAWYKKELIKMCPEIMLETPKVENSEYDFSDICTSNANNDKPDIRNK